MSNTVISNASVLINNLAISIVPNSVSYQDGSGEQNIRNETSGGNISSIVYSDDVSTHISMLKFKIYGTSENIANINDWKANKAQNALQLVDNDNDFTVSIVRAAMTNHPEINIGSDTDIDIEFKGSRSI